MKASRYLDIGRWRLRIDTWATRQYPRVTGAHVRLIDRGDGLNASLYGSLYGIGAQVEWYALASRAAWRMRQGHTA